MSEWISVMERLPERWQDVLITMISDGRMYVACLAGIDDFGDDIWEIQSNCDKCFGPPETVTHWMPLPEPPK